MKRSILQIGVNDLVTSYPEIVDYWDPTNDLSPENFLPGSPYTAKWICQKEHKWVNPIRQEVKKQNHCRECERLKPRKQVTLQEVQHKYSSKNIKPFSPNLPKTRRLLWDCPTCSSEYKQTLQQELEGIGCPYCAGKRIKEGVNDLATLYPGLVKYWDKTNPLPITNFGRRGQKNVKWECPDCLGKWTATPIVQTAKKSNAYCPYCSGNKLLSGFNDIATLHPEKAKQFHPTLNGTKKVSDFQPSSYKKVWWFNEKCGHEWEQTIANRMKSEITCLLCTNEKIIPGVNSLVDINPSVETYWNYKKNIVDPKTISPNSSIKIWLTCVKGHDWFTTPKTVSLEINCQVCVNKQTAPGFNDLATTHPELAAQWHPTKNLPLTPTKVTAGTHTRIHWICEKGHEWEAKGNDRVLYHTGCPECTPRNKSQAEDEIAQLIEKLGLTVQRHKRSIIGAELDLYIPEKQIAIEYNGVYWHSEKFKPRYYHYDKWLACKEKGIQLIQIWEDDWIKNSILVKNLITRKLGKINQLTTYARETQIVALSQETVNVFLKKYHIQGTTVGSIRLGLEKDNKLVAVILFKKDPGTTNLNLLRYATSQNVPGGFSKLLNYVNLTYHPEKITTFSDNMVSDGNLYHATGFQAVQQLAPDYTYLIRSQRVHKFQYRLKRFRNDPELQYEEGLTERELAELNGLNRIWDAGKTKWVKTINNKPIEKNVR